MSTPTSAGVLQTYQLIENYSNLIRDEIYGQVLVHEPVAVELLQTPELQRLKGICQHRATRFLGLTLQVTRLKHSVGVFILVQRVSATIKEQVTALLHDVSHNTLSHVIDHALSNPEEGIFKEELFTLVEMPSPQVCADHLDYALFDAVSFGKLSMEDARRAIGSLKVFPSTTATCCLLITTEKDVWSNLAYVDMYQRTGQMIHESVEAGPVDNKELWQLSDAEFWTLLWQTTSSEQLCAIKRLEEEGIPENNGL
ncbi:hypothetical protein BDV09DRAFT_204336 [Aspergillus tetrazonus]